MTVYAIADLHLPAGTNKPMDIFGAHWERHFERISEDWRARVTEEDIVLLPGDISWAMRLEDACMDLDAIGRLPGVKILTRGNHDYWWSSISRVREKLTGNTHALQNDAMKLGGLLFAGTRGWMLPEKDTADDDRRIFARECQRLDMSLARARRLDADAPLICMLHYPPLTDGNRDNEMTRILKAYGVHTVVYGHLHGAAICGAFQGEQDGIRYRLVSCDSLGLRLCPIWQTE